MVDWTVTVTVGTVEAAAWEEEEEEMILLEVDLGVLDHGVNLVTSIHGVDLHIIIIMYIITQLLDSLIFQWYLK